MGGWDRDPVGGAGKFGFFHEDRSVTGPSPDSKEPSQPYMYPACYDPQFPLSLPDRSLSGEKLPYARSEDPWPKGDGCQPFGGKTSGAWGAEKDDAAGRKQGGFVVLEQFQDDQATQAVAYEMEHA